MRQEIAPVPERVDDIREGIGVAKRAYAAQLVQALQEDHGTPEQRILAGHPCDPPPQTLRVRAHEHAGHEPAVPLAAEHLPVEPHRGPHSLDPYRRLALRRRRELDRETIRRTAAPLDPDQTRR